ncbi:MAG: SDR family oxidoreductase [Planctomycetota bacterium]
MPIAIVTGANRGIGLQLVHELASAGMEVIALVRDPSRMPSDSPAARVVRADVADDRSIEDAAAAIEGPCDLLICNAGVFHREPALAGFRRDAFLDTMSVNVAGPISVCSAFRPHLMLGSQKRILMISSQMGSIERAQGAGEFGYRCSKAALNMATKVIANELGPEGFSVASAHPGWVKTDMGGPDARVEVADSARALATIAQGLAPETNGRMLDFDGSLMPY